MLLTHPDDNNTTNAPFALRTTTMHWIRRIILLGIILAAGLFCYHAIISQPFQSNALVLPVGLIIVCIFWLSRTLGGPGSPRLFFLCLNTAFILLYILFSYFQFIARPVDIFALSGSFFVVSTLLYSTIHTCIPTIVPNWRRLSIVSVALVIITLAVSLYPNSALKPLTSNQVLILLGALACYIWLIFRKNNKLPTTDITEIHTSIDPSSTNKNQPDNDEN